MTEQSSVVRACWLIDGHVHFHGCFELQVFLDAAVANFARGAEELALTEAFLGVLLLAETSGDQYFAGFRDGSSSREMGGGWCFRQTAEPTSLIATRNGIDLLVLVAGRQVATREGLEVLALNGNPELSDGLSFRDSLEAVWDSRTVAVVPWGFGKWWLGRGRLLREEMRRLAIRPFFLGDNAGRPALLPEPALFRTARAHGIHILPGTDPLPFRSQQRKAGRYGCCVRSPLDLDRPGESVIRGLCNGAEPATFGQLESLREFCRIQTRMQWQKLVRGRGK
jgi:hypothetical protein